MLVPSNWEPPQLLEEYVEYWWMVPEARGGLGRVSRPPVEGPPLRGEASGGGTP